MYVCMYLCMYVCVCMYVCMYVYIYMYMCVCMCVCMCQFVQTAFHTLIPASGFHGFGRVLLPSNPRDLRTHILRLLGPKAILHKAFGLF